MADRSGFRLFFAVVVLMQTSVLTAQDALDVPPEDFDHVIALRRKLLKPLTIAPVDCRLDEALVRLGHEAGVLIHAEWKYLDPEWKLKPDRMVKLVAKDHCAMDIVATLLDAPNVWLPLTETGLHVLDEHDPGPYVTREYDLSRVMSLPRSSNMLDEEDGADTAEMMRQLADLVVGTIGDERDWNTHGGRRWHVSRNGTRLTLGMTLRMHEDWLRLLSQLSSARGLEVHLECRTVEAPSGAVTQLLKLLHVELKGGTAILNAELLKSLLSSLEKSTPAVRIPSISQCGWPGRERLVFIPHQRAAPAPKGSKASRGEEPSLRTITLPLIGQPAKSMPMQLHDGVTLRVKPRISGDRRYVSLDLDARYEGMVDAVEGKEPRQMFATASLARSDLPDKSTLLIRVPLAERKLIGVKQEFDARIGNSKLSVVAEKVQSEEPSDRALWLFVKPTIIADGREGDDPWPDADSAFPW